MPYFPTSDRAYGRLIRTSRNQFHSSQEPLDTAAVTINVNTRDNSNHDLPRSDCRFSHQAPQGGDVLNALTAGSTRRRDKESNRNQDRPLSFAGIGIGPANLSLAALSEPLPDLTYEFFDRRPEFTWHPGLNFPGTTIQVSFLKDLVTLVDPTSPYSFLSFLVAKNRLYRFLTANFPGVLRAEYDQYFRWASTLVPGLNFGHEVTAVDFDERYQEFRIETTRGHFTAENLVLGTGLPPAVPEACLPHLGEQVFHASEFTQRKPPTRGRDVVVLGGGQTGAEVFLTLLRDGRARPRRTTWITRRANFLPLDDSPFTNELFFPNFAQYFHGETGTRKARLLNDQKLASDGISISTLEEIYRELYTMECVQGNGDFYRLLPESELVGLERDADKLVVTTQSAACGVTRSMVADTLILCTGYEYRPPEFLAPLLSRICLPGGRFKISDDYSLDWDGPPGSRIYVQNAGRHEWGAADPNLSLLSWRSATIINSLVEYRRYDTGKTSSALRFGDKPEQSAWPAEYFSGERFDEFI